MEELNELKNLVMQNLENNGYLSNIRVQVGSSVFKTIESQEIFKKSIPPQIQATRIYTDTLKVQKRLRDAKGFRTFEILIFKINTNIQNTHCLYLA